MQWLSAINKYRADSTTAPCFAFSLVQRKTPEALRDQLDLSCLMVRRPTTTAVTILTNLADAPSHT
jgi:hypothetical protein